MNLPLLHLYKVTFKPALYSLRVTTHCDNWRKNKVDLYCCNVWQSQLVQLGFGEARGLHSDRCTRYFTLWAVIIENVELLPWTVWIVCHVFLGISFASQKNNKRRKLNRKDSDRLFFLAIFCSEVCCWCLCFCWALAGAAGPQLPHNALILKAS